MGQQDAPVVLITGAATGIGRRTAEAFLAEGCLVHICDVSPDAVDSFLGTGTGATASVADVSRRSDVDALFQDIKQQYGRLDVLVNNAGIAGPTAAVEDIDPDDWDQCIAVDLNGTFYVTRLAVPLLKASQGCIINIASTAGQWGYPNRSPYAAGKWAQIGLTKTWAMELGPSGVRVNAIAPGSVAGPRIDAVIERDAAGRGVPAATVRDQYLRQTSMRTFADASDIAAMAVFLASDAAARVSGQVIAVDGNTESLSHFTN